jgi:hypothetical protein
VNIGEASDVTTVLRALFVEDGGVDPVQTGQAALRLAKRAGTALQVSPDQFVSQSQVEARVYDWLDLDYEPGRPVEDVDTRGRT